MPRPQAILETVLYAGNIESTAQFYVSILQLEPVFSDDRMHALRVSDENFLLIFQAGATREAIDIPGGTIPPHDGQGPMHVAFAIGQDEVQSWSQHLRDNDVFIESTVSWPSGATSLYFRDPADNLVELATAGLWTQ